MKGSDDDDKEGDAEKDGNVTWEGNVHMRLCPYFPYPPPYPTTISPTPRLNEQGGPFPAFSGR